MGNLALAGERENSELHHRQDEAERLMPRAPQPHPAVLKPEMWPAWLGEQPATVPELKAILAPYSSEDIVCWPVSARVGKVKNNDPSSIEPINSALSDQEQRATS
jgi:putative SOS response-associated peptidase YedK